MKAIRRFSGAFALPTILIASIVLMMLLVVAMRVSSSIKDSMYSVYYNQLAISARDAGIAYAQACLAAGAGKPTWDSAGDGGADALTPANNCSGTAIAGASAYLVNTSSVRTTFSVPRTPVDSGGYGTQIRSTGIVQLLNSAGVVYRTISEPTPPALGSVTRYAVTTFAGSGAVGSANGTGTAATFNYPYGITMDSSGNIFVADSNNHAIRKITPAGVVSTVSISGYTLAAPTGVVLDSSGNLFVSDITNHTIIKITSAGIATQFAGGGSVGGTTSGRADGTGVAATFGLPYSLAIDSSNNIYAADYGNNSIRKITPAGVVTTFAGSTSGTAGGANGTGTAATFNQPYFLAFDANGNLFVAEIAAHDIREITPAGVVTTFAGVYGSSGLTDGTGTSAKFLNPGGVTFDSYGNMYVADRNNLLRKISANGSVTTVAGGGSVGGATAGSADGTDRAATFSLPLGLVYDKTNDVIYMTDYTNNRIRKITLQY